MGRKRGEKNDTKEQGLPWRLTSQSWGTILSMRWLWLLKKLSFADGGWGYRASQCQRGSHEIGQSALCRVRWPWGWVCLRWQVTVLLCASHTHPPPCVFETAITSQHTEGLGVGIQFHFFFSDKWHPDSWKKCWGPWTDFSVTKIKRVGLDKDRHFTFYFWTPMRALTNATPPPLRLCHDCFFSPEMSYS